MDLLDLLDDMLDAEKPDEVWAGRAPLNFTREYFHPDDHFAAHQWLIDDKRGGRFGSAVGRVHTWHSSTLEGWIIPERAKRHSLCMMDACLSCFQDGHGRDYDVPIIDHVPGSPVFTRPRTCYCIQLTLHKVVCTACRWQYIDDSKQRTVEAWHDHAFPGWRDLPLLPSKLRGAMGTSKMTPALEAWFADNYPEEFRVGGAPILTARDRIMSRHVPGYSPWGGFDMGIIREEKGT